MQSNPLALPLIIEMNSNGNLEFITPNINQLLGYQSEELINQNLKSILHPEDLLFSKIESSFCEEKENSVVTISRFKHRDGEFLFFDWRLYFYKGLENKNRIVLISSPIHNFEIHSNTTERKKFQEVDSVNFFRPFDGKNTNANQNLATILEHTPIMIVYLDTKFNFLYVNGAYAATCKLPASFFLGKNHFHLYPNEENQRIFQNVVEKGDPYFVEAKPFEFPDQPERGITFWNWSLVPIKDESGITKNLILTLEEVTEKIKAERIIEEAISLEFENLKKIQSAHFEINQRQFAIDQHAIVAITNLAGTIVYVNERFCEISQYSKEELIGGNHRIINSGFHDNKFWAEMYAAIHIGHTWHGEIRNKAKDGSYYWVATTIVPLKNEQGKNYQYFSIRTLITNRVMAEEALRQSEKRYRGLLTNIEAGVVIHAPDTSIIMNNHRASELLGLTEEQMKGKLAIDPNWKFLNEDKEPISSEDYPVSIIARDHVSIKNQIFAVNRPATKDTVWVMVNGYPALDSNGNISEIVISFIDITEMKKSEAMLKKYTQELQTLNKTKDRFFSIIAHDLRNPFAGITGLAEIMETKINADSDLSEKLGRYCRLIQATSKSAFSLLENLLLWAKAQTGEISVNRRNLSIHSLLSYTLPLVDVNALKKNITIESLVLENDTVYADEFLVNTILRNLLTNAIKFTHSYGKITISVTKKNNYLEIAIQDTGIGIESGNLKKIFKIDSKINRQGTENEKGTGLGLILCKEFVEMQGGKIWIKSKVGIGSTFYFSLPISAR